jgi:hypothetical protein
MAHVVFALGDRPGLSQDEALELAELLRRSPSFAALSASRKIRLQASRDLAQREEVSKNIELDRDELEELEAVLAQERHPELPGFERLQNEVHQALREGPPPSGQYGT